MLWVYKKLIKGSEGYAVTFEFKIIIIEFYCINYFKNQVAFEFWRMKKAAKTLILYSRENNPYKTKIIC